MPPKRRDPTANRNTTPVTISLTLPLFVVDILRRRAKSLGVEFKDYLAEKICKLI